MPESALKKTLPSFPQQHGVFILNKPAGPSSASCLRIFKKLGQKKVGHAGTLDPFAQGVLVVLLGSATKLSGYLMEGGHKTYSGMLELGKETDSWDITGNLLRQRPWNTVTPEAVKNCLSDWRNLSEQEVPSYSAAKHKGRPLYELARKGIDTPVKIKKINVSEAIALEIKLPSVTFRTSCSSGTYIRFLAHSLGTRLGCGAVLTKLVRVHSHPFDLADAASPDELEENPELLLKNLRPIETVLPDWQIVELSDQDVPRVKNGMAVTAREILGDRAILRHADMAIALSRLDKTGQIPVWRILRGLWS